MIWSATEWSDSPITVGAMAERMGVRPATVSDGIRRLAKQGLVTHAPYGSIELTATGREHAVEMVRRHRLLETFLVQVLGYGWDEVHDEAEILEHAVSDTMIKRIDERLGYPTRDPTVSRSPQQAGGHRRHKECLFPALPPTNKSQSPGFRTLILTCCATFPNSGCTRTPGLPCLHTVPMPTSPPSACPSVDLTLT